MWQPRLTRVLTVAGLSLASCAVAPGTVATAPPETQRSELRGACYCRAMGQLTCVGVTTKAECDKHCAEALCDEWFWLERLTCWSWGYGG